MSRPALDRPPAAQIEADIRSRGPINFARFMDLALYGPHGYYTRSQAAVGRDGDFVTGPEVSPALGGALGLLAMATHKALESPSSFRISELGPAAGRLMAALLDETQRQGFTPTAVVAVEKGVAQRHRLADRLAGRTELKLLSCPGELAEVEPSDGVIIAHEFFDALPFHRLRVSRTGVLEELFVTLGETGFEPLWAPSPDARLSDELRRLEVELAPGREVELCLEADAALRQAAASLKRGIFVIIDYGYPSRLLYDPGAAATARGFRGGRLVENLLADPGEQDITAHVDFSGLARSGSAAGLEPLLFAHQASFLVGLNAHELPEEARRGLVRLINFEEMGGTMKVLVLGREVPESLFAGTRDRRRDL